MRIAAMALACGLALAACGKSSNTTKQASATSSSTTASSTTTTTARTGARACTTSGLDITGESGGVGMGHQAEVLLFKNRGTQPCTLSGYPGVAALDASGNQGAQAQRTPAGYMGGLTNADDPIPVVGLAAGATASALLESTAVRAGNGNAASCPTYASFLVTPPGETHAARVTAQLAACTLEVHPVVPGTSGSPGR
jgi:hypothetical protein